MSKHRCPHCKQHFYTVISVRKNIKISERDSHARSIVDVVLAKRMRDDGSSFAKIGKHFGVSGSAVYELLKRTRESYFLTEPTPPTEKGGEG